MIRTVRIRGFKRFDEVEFRLLVHVVLAGPNNTGRTTVLQAIASWSLALQRWRELNDFNPSQGYIRAPIARQAFTAVLLQSFDLLWTDRRYRGQIKIELRRDAGWSVTMEFISDTTERIYVRPRKDVPPDSLRELSLRAVYVNKVTDRGDGRYSDVVLVVCPNVMTPKRLEELKPQGGEASLYRTRDLVPSHLMPQHVRGNVLVTNWRVFEPRTIQAAGQTARVLRAGREVRTRVGPRRQRPRRLRLLDYAVVSEMDKVGDAVGRAAE